MALRRTKKGANTNEYVFMNYDEINKHFGTLEDVQFTGFWWTENDLHVSLAGPRKSDYSKIICHWAYSLVVNLSWEDSNIKRSGPLLSIEGYLKELPVNELELLIDFGKNQFFSLKCKDVTLVF